MQHIFYIHGFLSGPTAAKATALKNYIQEHHLEHEFSFAAPDFPDTPQEAFQTLNEYFDNFVKEHPNEPMVLVGSSMGGFFSTLLGAKYACPMVLLNPCVHPQDYFEDLIGPQYNESTDRHFELKPEMLVYLKELDEATVIREDLTTVFLGDCDEVLDYRKSMIFYNCCDIRLIKGEDHAFTHDFKALIPQILDFARDNLPKHLKEQALKAQAPGSHALKEEPSKSSSDDSSLFSGIIKAFKSVFGKS